MVKFGIYAKAFFISVGIFFSGLLIGLYLERSTTISLSSKTSNIESTVQEIELEILYFQGLNESSSCNFLNEIIRKTNNNLDDLADQLSRYSEKDIILTRDDLESLKKRYSFLLIKDWLLQERIKSDCGSRSASILYFYDREGCIDCIVQGNILTSLKNSFKEKVMIFPLDIRVQLSMIDILRERFNVTKTPSLVIENKLYEGIVSKEIIKQNICNVLDANITECS